MRPALRGITRRKHRASHTPRYTTCVQRPTCVPRDKYEGTTTTFSPGHCAPANYIIMYLFYFRPRQRFRETKYDNTRALPYNSARYTCISHTGGGPVVFSGCIRGVLSYGPRESRHVEASRHNFGPAWSRPSMVKFIFLHHEQ